MGGIDDVVTIIITNKGGGTVKHSVATENND